MPKCRPFVLALMIILCLSGCASHVGTGDREAGIYEKIHHYYRKMKSYSARVRLTVKGNKTENVYETEQYVKGDTKSLVRVISPEDIRGTETVTNGEKTMVRKGTSDANALFVSGGEIMDICLASTFFQYYYRSEETAVSVSGKTDDSGTTLLETELMPMSADRKKATMLVDNKTLAPKTITVYDAGGNIVVMAEFLSFVYNDTVDDKMFEMES